MKTFVLTTGLLCLVIAALLVYANLQKTSVPVPIADSAPAAPSQQSEPLAVKTASHPVAPETTNRRVSPSFVPSASRPVPSEPTPFRRAIDTLVSRQSTFQEKQAAWKQLHEASQFDDAIEALKQGAKDNPDSPEYAAMLGQAYLQKAGEVSKNGGSVNELGILGMQADQSFDNALKLDPSNWDAQFFKAVAMSYWPAELNKSDEVVQRLSGLITQQDSLSPQPEFAMPYIALGQQYQKLGQTDNALQTWQAGASLFPNDTTLQQKLASAPSHP